MKALKQTSKFFGFTILLLIIQLITHSLFNYLLPIQDASVESPLAVLIGLVGCSALTTAVLIPFIRFSPWSFWKTTVVATWILFGMQTLLSHLEVLFFNSVLQMTRLESVKMLVEGAVTSLLFVPILTKGYFRNSAEAEPNPIRFPLRMILIVGISIYPVIYWIFGSIIQTIPSHRKYYAAYYAEMTEISPALLFLFQGVRGIIWILLLFPLIQLQTKRKALYAGVLSAVLMSAVLLIPNPYMPDINRYIHLGEIFCSNFIWGSIVVSMFRRRAHFQKFN